MDTSPTSTVRRLVLRLVIGSFSLAALMGIAALLRPGPFGSTEGRILLTTLVVGVTSVLMLCYLAPNDERWRLVGVAGGVAALVALCAVLVMVWGYWQRDPGGALARTFGLSLVAALSLAQLSLMIAVVRHRLVVQRLLVGTVAAAAVLAALVDATILGWDPGGAAARLIGVVAILDVLGTVVVLAVGLFGRDETTLRVTLSSDVAARVRAVAQETGTPLDAVADDGLRSYFGSLVG
jgi:hypothetical protein